MAPTGRVTNGARRCAGLSTKSPGLERARVASVFGPEGGQGPLLPRTCGRGVGAPPALCSETPGD